LGVNVGVVVIGRNEGERLERCLASLVGMGHPVVYVDSASTDGSVAMALAQGVEVVELDMNIPFTAARARNAGFVRLRTISRQLRHVQFIDGDCELAPVWLAKAVTFLAGRDDVAAVCGRLREKHPQRSIYNMLCDMEWDRPTGETNACGGIAMMRADAFEGAGGFRADLIAGEEPELCVRLRGAGWRIWRLADEMAFHDAAIARFGQWWTRTMRGGYAFAQGAALHGGKPECHGVRESRSIWFWGLGLPLMTATLAGWAGGWWLALLFAYPVQVIRLALRKYPSKAGNWWQAVFLVLGKFPEMLGQVKFLLQRQRGGQARLIEYK
jgi:GT2 family glycosyltransferase